MPEVREHRLTDAEAGRRLDQVIAERWPDLSRTRVQNLMARGLITREGAPIRPRETARAGERLTVVVPEPEPTVLVAEAIPLDILHEDEEILVVNKPPGLVVQPGAGNRSGTLVNALLHHRPGLAAVGGVARPGVVHRLDKGTSGLLVVAKTDRAHRALTEALARREVRRRYRALSWGEPRAVEGRIEAPIGRHPRDRKRMAVVEGGRPAATRWRRLESFGWAAHLECALETGRTHQIRVHLASIGHPLVGDAAYGGGARRALNVPQAARRLARDITGVLQRPALHAARLEFAHPATGSAVAFEAPVPADFTTALEFLRRFQSGASAGPAA